MDWRKFVPKLEYDRKSSVYTDEGVQKDWMNYLQLSGIQPLVNASLFDHTRYIDQTLLERVCLVGKKVVVKLFDQERVDAVVEICCGDMLRVSMKKQDRPEESESNWVHAKSLCVEQPPQEKFNSLEVILLLQDIVNKEKAGHCRDEVILKASEKIKDRRVFTEISDVLNRIDQAGANFHSVIEVGQLFEYQLPWDPRRTVIAKVVNNHREFVEAEFEFEGSVRQIFVNIHDIYCHEIGWTSVYPQKLNVQYYVKEGVDWESIKARQVPKLVFERENMLEKHEFKVGDMCELLSEDRTVFYYAHVESILDDYYVRLHCGSFMFAPSKSDDPLTQQSRMVVHLRSDHIFPVGTADLLNARLVLANGHLGLRPCRDFDWETYKRVFSPHGGYLNDVGLQLDEEKERLKVPNFRYLEVYDNVKGAFKAGLVHRVDKGFFWLLLSDDNQGKPALFHLTDTRLYPCGTANAVNIPFLLEPRIKTLPQLAPNQKTRFQMRKFYTSIPPRLHDESKKAFIPKIYLEGDQWVPRICVRRGCCIGPNLDLRRVHSLRRSYDAGPLPFLIKQVVKDLMSCVKDKKRNFLNTILNEPENSIMPTMTIKYRLKHLCDQQNILRLPVCETARQFPIWLRMILRMLGACPNILSYENTRICMYNCKPKPPVVIKTFSIAVRAKLDKLKRSSSSVKAKLAGKIMNKIRMQLGIIDVDRDDMLLAQYQRICPKSNPAKRAEPTDDSALSNGVKRKSEVQAKEVSAVNQKSDESTEEPAAKRPCIGEKSKKVKKNGKGGVEEAVNPNVVETSNPVTDQPQVDVKKMAKKRKADQAANFGANGAAQKTSVLSALLFDSRESQLKSNSVGHSNPSGADVTSEEKAKLQAKRCDTANRAAQFVLNQSTSRMGKSDPIKPPSKLNWGTPVEKKNLNKTAGENDLRNQSTARMRKSEPIKPPSKLNWGTPVEKTIVNKDEQKGKSKKVDEKKTKTTETPVDFAAVVGPSKKTDIEQTVSTKSDVDLLRISDTSPFKVRESAFKKYIRYSDSNKFDNTPITIVKSSASTKASATTDNITASSAQPTTITSLPTFDRPRRSISDCSIVDGLTESSESPENQAKISPIDSNGEKVYTVFDTLNKLDTRNINNWSSDDVLVYIRSNFVNEVTASDLRSIMDHDVTGQKLMKLKFMNWKKIFGVRALNMAKIVEQIRMTIHKERVSSLNCTHS